MKSIFILMCIICVSRPFVMAQDDSSQNVTKETRESKFKRQFSFLQVVNFPNNICPGTGNRNGTCYTSDECLSKRGVSSGSCANGFGVCCVFSLQCGQTSSENCTYLTLASTSTTTMPTNCIYTLCEANPNICRMRLDFMSFTIAGPVVGTTVIQPGPINLGGGIGDCVTDSFVFNAPGNKGSPTICGVNTGQHMIIDTSSTCAQAAFSFGSAAAARSYDIKVTQFACQDEVGGPPDCLQYFSATSGTIKSFNFGFTAAPVTSTATHLSSQCYAMCIRRASGMCGVCFSPTINPVTPTAANQASFGLSGSPTAATAIAQGSVDTTCSSDYLIVPNANTKALISVLTVTPHTNDRFCGRFFNLNDASTMSTTLCTVVRPFKIIFKTDSNELNIAINNAATNELELSPGGIVGFSLDYFQISC